MLVSIEIAHIELLPDGAFNRLAVERSIVLGARLKGLLEARGVDTHITVLVDDRQLAAAERDSIVNDFVETVSTLMAIDSHCSEGRLSSHLDNFLSLIAKESVRRRRSDDLWTRIQQTGHLPCAADISIWHLLRLGLIPDPRRVVEYKGAPAGPADFVISILPEMMREPEEVAENRYLKHIEAAAGRIHRVYFPASADGEVGEEDLLSAVETITPEVYSHE